MSLPVISAAAFPEAAQDLGINELLSTPITDATAVAGWTDSVCNASVPMPQSAVTGVLPKDSLAGVRNYPRPIVDIQFIKYDDVHLWVTDEQGNPAAVVPVSPRGSGDARVRVLWATDGSDLQDKMAESGSNHEPLVLDVDHPITIQAFSAQGYR